GNQPADISVTHRRDVLLRRPQEIQMHQNREPIAIDTESHISPTAISKTAFNSHNSSRYQRMSTNEGSDMGAALAQTALQPPDDGTRDGPTPQQASPLKVVARPTG
ncbi:hypothetical protein, partial [Paraburkholderia ginsengiterrae]|uniref:hypothetical protein n=1 Tax=Paraburkholderia ginsengiterrae TaxID=1462993 RepID=UPI001ABF5981